MDALACQFSVTECCVGLVPDPLSATVVGELVALLTQLAVPVLVPLPDGANVTVAAAEAPAANVNGNCRPETVKPLPVALAEEIVADEVPVFVSVTAFEAELPTSTEPNAMEVGDADTLTVDGVLMVTFASPLDDGDATLVAMTLAVPAVAGAV